MMKPAAVPEFKTRTGIPMHTRDLYASTLGALGVVYGDIGTSPLYALRESFQRSHGIPLTSENVLGILSLIFWSLIVVISVKYLVFVLRADNNGEGGILALTSLVTPMHRSREVKATGLIALGVFGTALLYGDGAITPAISVLSAVEGVGVASPRFGTHLLPITVVILVALFAFQRHGTGAVGKVFGPVMALWFCTLAFLGALQIARHPQVLAAADPMYGLNFFQRNGWKGLLVLGSVFLVVTGGEALYADMGHFGTRPIRLAWSILVLPALVLNYFGQGAFLLLNPLGVENPFYLMAPQWALVPLVVIATAATVIASQALISGAFSLTMQAVQLGYLPRVRIQHTSAKTRGQVYIAGVNWALMAVCIGLVLGFRTSSNLAGAYGVGVTTIMVITTLLFFFVARDRWHWGTLPAAAVAGLFGFVDLSFWTANLPKISRGGWFPLLAGISIFVVMTTWKRGRDILRDRLNSESIAIEELKQQLTQGQLLRSPGTAIYMTRNALCIPPALMLNVRHHRCVHERIVLLAIETQDTPYVDDGHRAVVEPLGDNMFRITVRYGFMQEPDVPAALKLSKTHGCDFDASCGTFFLGREDLVATSKPGMAIWRERLFALMARNAQRATRFYKLPAEAVLEVGGQIEL
jgi:KUP system potassium uptake protein